MLQGSIFSFYITENNVSIPQLFVKKTFGKYNIFIDDQTPYNASKNENCECVIFGVAVNVVTGESEKIVEKILTDCSCVQEVVEYEKQLGGKYVLLYKNGENYYIQGDATCSIPVFYNIDDELICSSNYQYILNAKKYTLHNEYKIIRNSGDISQAMPYDITPCKEIRQLIPNHYLDMKKSEAVRLSILCIIRNGFQ